MQFVDTHYLLALVNSNDVHHAAAVRYSPSGISRLLTTTWVLVEFADALCRAHSRIPAVRFIRKFRSYRFVEVIPPSSEQFDRALRLYENRPDKDWSLTDCLSFQIMQDRGVAEALTGDHHFEQAGFRALLLNT